MSLILYIDTSAAKSTIMLMDEENILAFRNNEIQNDHSKFINVHIDEVLNECKIDFNQLSAICVLNGPGSYTGLRISLATAKGIAYVNSTPLILINKLDLISSCVNESKKYCVIIKARENEYFFALYDEQKNLLNQHSLISTEDLIALNNQNEIEIFADCDEILSENLKANHIEINNNAVLSYCFLQFQTKNYADLFTSEPFYMKNVYINKINKL